MAITSASSRPISRPIKDKYFTGDGARRDEDGYCWITGRVDDVINVSGHRMGTAEVESALVAHPKVSEAAVVGYPHDIKGQGIYCYVTLMAGEEASDELRKELVAHVRNEIGPIASPDKIQFSPGLPKTRSGKIMRRILQQDRRGRFRRARRHLDAGRSGGRRRPDRQPAEQEGLRGDALGVRHGPKVVAAPTCRGLRLQEMIRRRSGLIRMAGQGDGRVGRSGAPDPCGLTSWMNRDASPAPRDPGRVNVNPLWSTDFCPGSVPGFGTGPENDDALEMAPHSSATRRPRHRRTGRPPLRLLTLVNAGASAC